jgi:hypothetical protein
MDRYLEEMLGVKGPVDLESKNVKDTISKLGVKTRTKHQDNFNEGETEEDLRAE